MTIVIVNPVMAFFRPAKDAGRKRYLFNFFHGILGRVSRIISAIAVTYILAFLQVSGDEMKLKGYELGAVIAMWVVLGVELITAMSFFFLRNSKSYNRISQVLWVFLVILGIVATALVINAYYKSKYYVSLE